MKNTTKLNNIFLDNIKKTDEKAYKIKTRFN